MKMFQLEYFCSVCYYKSITRAADELHVSQPAISTAIKDLENEYDVSLFHRIGKKLILTSEGEIFYDKALDLLKHVEAVSQELWDLGQRDRTIKIGIPPMISTIFFPQMLVEFNRFHPDISVELFELGSIKAGKMVENEVLDIAIVNMGFPHVNRMHTHIMLPSSVVFCVSPMHPMAMYASVRVEELKNQRLIMMNTDSVQNMTIHNRFEYAGIMPNVVLHSSQLYTIKNFLSENDIGVFLYEAVCRANSDIVGIPIVPTIEENIGIVWKKGKYIPGYTSQFISFAQNYLP